MTAARATGASSLLANSTLAVGVAHRQRHVTRRLGLHDALQCGDEIGIGSTLSKPLHQRRHRVRTGDLLLHVEGRALQAKCQHHQPRAERNPAGAAHHEAWQIEWMVG